MYKHLNSEQRYAIYLILKEYVPKRHCGCYSGKPLNDSTPVGTIQKMDKKLLLSAKTFLIVQN